MAKKTQSQQVIEKPVWLKMSEDDVKKIIAELAAKYQPAQVGTILRDQYGVPTTKIFGKKLSKYIDELGIATKEIELQNVTKKVERIKEHMKKHPQDKKAKHKLQRPSSRIQKIKHYLAR